MEWMVGICLLSTGRVSEWVSTTRPRGPRASHPLRLLPFCWFVIKDTRKYCR